MKRLRMKIAAIGKVEARVDENSTFSLFVVGSEYGMTAVSSVPYGSGGPEPSAIANRKSVLTEIWSPGIFL
jgi:hypothetical protein